MTWTFYNALGEEKNEETSIFVGTSAPVGRQSLWLDTDEVDIPRISEVSTLPASPVSGQEVYYRCPDSPWPLWHLRYNPGWGDAYKWDFLGGPPLIHEVQTTQAPTSNGAWINLATNGPLLTIPLAGYYDVMWHCLGYSNAASACEIYAGIAIGDTNPLISHAAVVYIINSLAMRGNLGGHWPLMFAAGDIAKMRYYSSASFANNSFSNRRIAVTPRRVA